VAAIELALMAPAFVLLLLGGYDIARFVGIRAGVDKVSFSVADVTSQYDQLTSAAMYEIFKVTGASLPSYVSGTNGVTILSSLYLDSSNVQRVKWQCYSTAGTTWKSKIGTPAAVANISAGLMKDPTDNLIVAEVYYKFTPLFSAFYKTGFVIYTSSTYRPRLGTLTTAPSSC
jgi:Flp pilus assembly protein TadG